MQQQRNMFQQAQQRAKLAAAQNVQSQQFAQLQNRVAMQQQQTQMNRNQMQAQRGNSWHHLLMGQNYGK